MNAIEIKNLEFQYPNSEKLNLSIGELQIKEGEKVFLLGESGSGKTTLLEILAGVLNPQKGEVQVLQQDLAKMSATAKDQFRGLHFGFIFQSFNLIPYLNVYQNIILPVQLNPDRQKKMTRSIEAEVDFLLNELGIFDLKLKNVLELSVGQQQRVAVVRALLGQPKVIFADEPTSALDYSHREKFIQLLFKQCQSYGATLVFVSHDLSLQKLFDRTIQISEINLSQSQVK